MCNSYLQIGCLIIATGMLEMYYQFIQTDRQILEPWRAFWFKWVAKYVTLESEGIKVPFVTFMAYIAKPIALCPYCNGTWLSIIVYMLAFGFTWHIFLFIGMVWMVIRIIDKYKLL